MKGSENMAKLPETLRTAVKRKRGEQNISVIELATQTGVSRWTLDKILKGTTDNVRPTTVSKLNPGLFIKTNKDPLKQQVNTVSAGFALSPVG